MVEIELRGKELMSAMVEADRKLYLYKKARDLIQDDYLTQEAYKVYEQAEQEVDMLLEEYLIKRTEDAQRNAERNNTKSS